MQRARSEGGAREPPRRTVGDRGPARVDCDDHADDEERPPGRVDLPRPVDEATDGRVGDEERDEAEDPRLGQGGEVLGLVVAVGVSAVGRTDGNAHGEERQVGRQRGRCPSAPPRRGARGCRWRGPVTSLIAISTIAAPTETRAIRRWGLIGRSRAQANLAFGCRRFPTPVTPSRSNARTAGRTSRPSSSASPSATSASSARTASCSSRTRRRTSRTWSSPPTNGRSPTADREDVSVVARTADRVQAPRAALARAGTRAAPLLAALVAASFFVRLVLGWLRATPTFFADEYIYGELGPEPRRVRPPADPRRLGELPRPPPAARDRPGLALRRRRDVVPGHPGAGRGRHVTGGGARLPPRPAARAGDVDLPRPRRRSRWPCRTSSTPAGSWPSRTPTRLLSAPSPSARSRSPARASGFSSPSWRWPGWRPSPASSSPSFRSASSPPSSSSACASGACAPALREQLVVIAAVALPAVALLAVGREPGPRLLRRHPRPRRGLAGDGEVDRGRLDAPRLRRRRRPRPRRTPRALARPATPALARGARVRLRSCSPSS